jgi:hypothetical protein
MMGSSGAREEGWSVLRCGVVVLALASSSCRETAADYHLGTEPAPVIGGAIEDGYPAVGWLEWSEQLGRTFCGATLIAPDIAVTAAHCVMYDFSNTLISGDIYFDLGRFVSRGLYRVRKIIPHPEFVNGLGYPWPHDIAVLVLESRTFSTAPAHIAVPPAADCKYRFIGYGRETEGDQWETDGYHSARKSLDMCVTDLENPLNIVAHGTDGGNCYGDSGGALVIDGTDKLVGLTSTPAQAGCTTQNLVNFTPVAPHEGFIQRAIACKDSDDPYCVYTCAARDRACSGTGYGDCCGWMLCIDGTCVCGEQTFVCNYTSECCAGLTCRPSGEYKQCLP